MRGPSRPIWLRTAAAGLACVTALAAPSPASADDARTVTAPYFGRGGSGACAFVPLHRSECAWEAYPQTGVVTTHALVESPSDGDLPGREDAFAFGLVTAVDMLPDDVEAVEYTFEIDLDAALAVVSTSDIQDAARLSPGAASVSVTADATHASCDGCITEETATQNAALSSVATGEHTYLGPSTIVVRLRHPDEGRVPAGGVTLTVRLWAHASIGAIAPAAGRSTATAVGQLQRITVHATPVGTTTD